MSWNIALTELEFHFVSDEFGTKCQENAKQTRSAVHKTSVSAVLVDVFILKYVFYVTLQLGL